MLNATRYGGFGQIGEGYVNIPLSNRAAVRIVGWAEHDDGYIDNRLGSRFYETCDFDVGCLGTGPVDENSDVADQNYNSADTWGGRIALGIDLNDSWTVTPQIMGQHQRTNGVFSQQSHVGELAVMHFFPEWNEDSWIQGALTIEGQINNFDIVFSASRLSRDVDSNQDYADYGYFYDVFAGYGCYFVDNAGAGSVCDIATGGARLGNPINPGQQVEGLKIEAMRDDEWVFTGYSFTRMLWIDRQGKLREGEVPAEEIDDLWGVGFYNETSRDLFIALRLEHSADGMNLPHSGPPTMHYNHHGQLWSRYPSGPASLKAGTKVFQKNAYLVSPWTEKDATGRIEQLRHQLMNPLDRRFQTPSGLDNTGVNGTPLARFGETRETAPLKAEIWKRMREPSFAELLLRRMA